MPASYIHRGGDPPLLGETIDERLAAIAARYPDRDAVVSRPQRWRLSYRELDAEVDRLARALIAAGIDRGGRVGIWSTNNVEWLVLQMATARIGAVLVNINPANRAAELEHAMNAARVEALFMIPAFRSSDYRAILERVRPRLASLRRVFVYDPGDRATWEALVAGGRSVSAAAVAERAAAVDRDDPINVQFTSGTTGFPKPVVLSSHGILNNAYFVGERMRLGPEDRLCVPVPFYHCFGMVLSNLACLCRGAAVVIPSEHFDPAAAVDAVEAEGCTAMHGVPTMFIAALEQQRRRRRDLSTLRTGIMAGAPCPPELMRQVIDELGCREILIAYGQTEASPVTHLTTATDSFERRVETVGTNLPHQEVKIVDTESGATVVIGERGELCFRGYHVMRGYFDNPEATARAIDDAGWLHSGDVGWMDADGYARITGRLKDMIIRGGENIYPAEIEAFYFEHPDVENIAVFGLPDERLGEIVAAWVILRQGSTTTAEALREWARDKISHFKIPARIDIVDELPMTVTGKVQKYRIRDLAAAALNTQHRGTTPEANAECSRIDNRNVLDATALE